jgi:hypothetical protein
MVVVIDRLVLQAEPYTTTTLGFVRCVICWLCDLLLQFNNPFHLWMLWDPEVREQRRCLARHNQMMGEKVRQLRKTPPAPHTIAGTSYSWSLT